MIDGAVIKQFGRDDLLDDFLKDLLAEFLSRDRLSVLGGDDDSIDAKRDGRASLLLVLDSDLGLGVGAEPSELTRAARNSHGGVELVGEHDGEGHELLSLISGVAEHDTLVTSTVVLKGAVVKTLRDIGRLLLDGNEDVAGLVVEALGGVVIADLLDGVADDLLVVELGLGSDLAENHDHAGLGGRLAGDLGEGVLGEAGIELTRQKDSR